MWSTIFIEGYNAYRGGTARVANPYIRFGTDARLFWKRGWDRAEVSNAERKAVAGRHGGALDQPPIVEPQPWESVRGVGQAKPANGVYVYRPRDAGRTSPVALIAT